MSSAVPSLPQRSLRSFPGTEQIYPYRSSLEYAGGLQLPPLLSSLEVSVVSLLQLGSLESTFAGEEAQSKGEPKSFSDVLFILNLLFKFCKHL